MPHYGDYQNAIYFAGLSGVVPKVPVDFATLAARATAAMPASVRDYVQGGCGDEYTQDHNAAAFRHWGMVPRMMVDCATRDLSIDLFGLRLPSPIFMAPIGVTGLMTPDGHGDLAAARAAGLQTAFVPRPDEFGTGEPEAISQQWDVIAEDFGDLAERLGA